MLWKPLRFGDAVQMECDAVRMGCGSWVYHSAFTRKNVNNGFPYVRKPPETLITKGGTYSSEGR